MNYSNIKYFILFFCFISTILVSQSRIDSLQNLVDNSTNEIKVDLLNQMTLFYIEQNDSENAILHAESALETSGKLDYERGKAIALNNLASVNLSLRKPSEALKYSDHAINICKKFSDKKIYADALRNFATASLYVGEKDSAAVNLRKALTIYNELDDSLNLGITFSAMGEAYTYLNESPKMITSYLHALEIFKKLGDDKHVALIYLNMGSVYSNILSDYQKAIEYAFLALEIYNKLGDEIKKTYCYLIIGSAHEYLGNLDKALEQYKKSLEICSKTDNKYLLANTENYIGEAYNKQHNIEYALESYSKSLEIYFELDDAEGIAVANNNIGECYYKLGDLNKALSHYTRSFNYFDKRGEIFQLSELVLNIGNVYFSKKDYNSAVNSFKRSIKYAKESNSLESLKDSYKAISNTYKEMQQPEHALNYLELYIDVKDSLINRDILATIADYEAKYKVTENAKKIELLKKENELTEANAKLKTILIISLVAVTILLIVFVIIYYRRYKQKNTLNQRLAESELYLQKLNFTKNKFFSIIAHDLRGSLGTLSGLTEILDEDAEEMDKESIIEISKDIHQISKNTINLLNNLLTWASVQIGKMETSKESFNFNEVVVGVHELLKENLSRKNISFSNEIPNDVFVYADKNMISSAMRNLIHNAIKFTHENGKVIASSEINNGHVYISINDNGVGIPEENIEKLFEIGNKISTYGTKRESGSGLGLILTKEFIDKNNGSIQVESQIGIGTNFTIKLPH